MVHGEPPKEPDYNPYCLPKRYMNRFPREFLGGQPCMDEFTSYLNCLVASKFDKQVCEEANRLVDRCMMANRHPVRSSFKYHLSRMIKNKYRLPGYK